ncbi:unnamed protein product, partial [Rotaria sp. Silwood1]
MKTPAQIHSHCLVQWKDNKNEYAIVHGKRAKASFILKVSLTTSSEGNRRICRR